MSKKAAGLPSYDGPNYVIKIDGEVAYSSPTPISQDVLAQYAKMMERRPNSRMEITRIGAVTKVAWSIDQVRQILDAKQYGKVDGMQLDTFSASALVQIYDALSPENQAKLAAMSLDRAMNVVWKLMNKTGSRDNEHYVVRGGDNGSYDVLSGPYDQPEAVNVSAQNAGSSTMSGTQLDSSTIGTDYRFSSVRTAAPEPGSNEFYREPEEYGPELFTRSGNPSWGDQDDSETDDEFYDDFAHEGKIERHAIADEFDTRPLHTRVATAFLKKG